METAMTTGVVQIIWSCAFGLYWAWYGIKHNWPLAKSVTVSFVSGNVLLWLASRVADFFGWVH